jgi:hypothetical protein
VPAAWFVAADGAIIIENHIGTDSALNAGARSSRQRMDGDIA